MAFHRLTVPTYFGGLPGGYDYLNNATSGTPAPADGQKVGGPNAGTYFVGFGDDALSLNVNRGFLALGQNCDFFDNLFHQDIAVRTTTGPITPSSPVSAITVAGVGQYFGAVGTPNSPQGIATFCEVLDQNGELIFNGTDTVRVVSVTGVTPGSGFSAAASNTYNLSSAIQTGQQYQLYYSQRGNLASLPTNLFTQVKTREDFGPTTTGSSGAERIGSAAVASASPFPLYALAAGSINSQLQTLLDVLNSSVRVDFRSTSTALTGTGINVIQGYNLSLTLPAPNIGAIVVFIAQNGWVDATYPCTLVPHSGELINGIAANYLLQAPNGRWVAVCIGGDWKIFSC